MKIVTGQIYPKTRIYSTSISNTISLAEGIPLIIKAIGLKRDILQLAQSLN